MAARKKASKKKAAKKKVARASYNLGLMAYSGEGMKQDDKAAIRYFKNAEKLGHKDSILELARIYSDKASKEQNKRLSKLYIKKAIALSFKEAKMF